MSQLTDLLSRRSLAVLADAGSLFRGGSYASDGRVEDLEVSTERATALVRGTVPYAVELWVERSGALGWSCSCPVAEDGRFCKHTVAVALVAGEGVSRVLTAGEGGAGRTGRAAPSELVVPGPLTDKQGASRFPGPKATRNWMRRRPGRPYCCGSPARSSMDSTSRIVRRLTTHDVLLGTGVRDDALPSDIRKVPTGGKDAVLLINSQSPLRPGSTTRGGRPPGRGDV